mgnify:CR=1 FL=1
MCCFLRLERCFSHFLFRISSNRKKNSTGSDFNGHFPLFLVFVYKTAFPFFSIITSSGHRWAHQPRRRPQSMRDTTVPTGTGDAPSTINFQLRSASLYEPVAGDKTPTVYGLKPFFQGADPNPKPIPPRTSAHIAGARFQTRRPLRFVTGETPISRSQRENRFYDRYTG